MTARRLTFLDRLGMLASGGFDALAEHLPALPEIDLDPEGPIMRRARGAAVDPFAWSQELANLQARLLLAGAPDDLRNAQVTADVPGLGPQSMTLPALWPWDSTPAISSAAHHSRAKR